MYNYKAQVLAHSLLPNLKAVPKAVFTIAGGLLSIMEKVREECSIGVCYGYDHYTTELISACYSLHAYYITIITTQQYMYGL